MDAYVGRPTGRPVTAREAGAHPAAHVDGAGEGAPAVVARGGTPVAATVPVAGFEALEEAAGLMPAREAEAVPAGEGPTATTAEPLAALFTEQDGEKV
ncbi:hypothetical protein GCM10009564_33120 [Streptomyces thermogriseus]|jgi:antitoxin (DNA-binding transcriptional repressor) of toxin-antitoxin stability system|uniref:Prevent-host-death family protein n=1 Tax=Streptomyces thermogriseus TaxID=75292 RepID=A0ABN1T1F1_9ACTN